jgi:hypothetical protein
MTSTIFGGKQKQRKGDDDDNENSDVDNDFTDEAPDEPDVENNDSELYVTDHEDIAEDSSKKWILLAARLLMPLVLSILTP